MNEEQVVPSCRLSGMSFSLFSAAEIRKLSVKEVTNPQTFDVLMHPTSGGLHDPAFGKSYPALGLSLTLPSVASHTACFLESYSIVFCLHDPTFDVLIYPNFKSLHSPAFGTFCPTFTGLHDPTIIYFIPFSGPSATPPLVSPSPVSVISTTQHLSLQPNYSGIV